MKEIVEIIETKKRWQAKDGRIFNSKNDCEIYEKYYNTDINEEIQKYCIFFNKEVINNDYIFNKTFIYCIVLKPIPEELVEYIKIIENENISSSHFSNLISNLYDFPTLCYNNWVNDKIGKCGFNGWEKIGTKDYLEYKLERIFKELQYFNQI